MFVYISPACFMYMYHSEMTHYTYGKTLAISFPESAQSLDMLLERTLISVHPDHVDSHDMYAVCCSAVWFWTLVLFTKTSRCSFSYLTIHAPCSTFGAADLKADTSAPETHVRGEPHGRLKLPAVHSSVPLTGSWQLGAYKQSQRMPRSLISHT